MNQHNNNSHQNHGIDDMQDVTTIFATAECLMDSRNHDRARVVLLEGLKAEDKTSTFHRVGRNPAILNSIGVASYGLQNLEEALLFFKLAFRVSELSIWENRIFRADIRINIGLTLMSLRREAEAMEWLRRACVVIEEFVGPEDKRMLQTQRNLAVAYLELGKLDLVVKHLGEACQVSALVNGRAHLETIEIMEMIAWANHSLGLYKEANNSYSEAILLREQIGVDAAETMYCQGVTFQSLGQIDDALALLQQAWTNFQQGECQDTALGANISKSIGLVHSQKGQFLPAIAALTRAWRMETRCLGAAHPNTANTIANLGVVYCDLGNISKSIRLSQLALRIRRRCGVSADEEAADVHHNLAFALSQSKRRRRSRHQADIAHHFKRSYHLYDKLLGMRSEKTTRTGKLLSTLGREGKGVRIVTRAMEQRWRR